MLGEEVVHKHLSLVHKHLSVGGAGAVHKHLEAMEVGGEEAQEWKEARLRNKMKC